MKLLILTQKIDINDDLLGFFYDWVAEFAKQCEKITVIALGVGEYDLPANVKVLSLGKETGRSRLKYIFNFYKFIWRERGNYDKVLIHMNVEYVILGAALWRILDKKIGLWYTHKHVGLKLKLSEKLVDVVFTASPESFRLHSEKLKILGHGINTERFNPASRPAIKTKGEFEIIAGGRISPVKKYETIILAAEILKVKGFKFKINIFGQAPAPEQEKYLADLKQLVEKKQLDGEVRFLGGIANRDLAKYFLQANIFIHTSRTGSLDKVVLEAMACALPVLSSSEGLNSVLCCYKEKLMFKAGDYKELAKKIEEYSALSITDRMNLGDALRQIVVEQHDVKKLIRKIIDQLSKI